MQKLIEALHVIKDECKKHDGEHCCEECPMGMETGECRITYLQPHEWIINDEVQKALL